MRNQREKEMKENIDLKYREKVKTESGEGRQREKEDGEL